MKIILVNYRFFVSGGPERYMFNVIDKLESTGCTVIPFSVKNIKNEFSPYSNYFARNVGNSDEYLYEKFGKNFLFYFDYLTREFYSFYIRRKINRLIKREKPDICYLLPHKGSLSPSIIDAFVKNKVPIIHRISDYNIICPQGGLYRQRKFCDDCKLSCFNVVRNRCIKNSIYFSIIRYISTGLHRKLSLYKKIDHFVTTNDYARERFIEFGYNPDKITTIKTFSNVKYAKDQINTTYPIKFIYIGNTDDSKGIYDLLDAIKELVMEFDDYYFILEIYGGLRDFERDKILSIISQFNLTKIVSLNEMRSTNDIIKIYQNSDVTIIPSRWVENLPNVLVESLSNSTPVIVPNFGSFSSVIDESVAYFFEPYSIISLKNVLKEIIIHPLSIVEKSQKCLDFSNTKFGTEDHMEMLLSLFKQYIKK